MLALLDWFTIFGLFQPMPMSLKEPQARRNEPKARGTALDLPFPTEAIIGSVGALAQELARGSEVPEEFYFAAGLTILGAICSPALTVNIGIDIEPRLYSVLIGESYAVKKTTAMKKTVQFFEGLAFGPSWKALYGVGSAEGLARELKANPRTILVYDELRAFIDKCNVQNSALLPMTTSLFETRNWDNSTKRSNTAVSIRGAHLSLLGGCTIDTYSSMWTNSAIAIGFPNRLFVVTADRKRKMAWPEAPNEETLTAIRRCVQHQIARLPLSLDITADAKKAWEDWYYSLPTSEHSKRLDTIGFRLLALIALTTDKERIELDTVQVVRSILDYELHVRRITDPIDAENTIARLEEAIRRALGNNTWMKVRDLRRRVHADRYGIWAFKTALDNLMQVGDITQRDGGYQRAFSG